MRSIDNLREWANGLHGVYVNQVDHTITVTTGWDAPPDMDSVSIRDHVNGILDGIEREVEELREREYQNGREDAEGAVEFADRLKAAVDKREDVTLWGVDYTALPLDADGAPIHVGDRLYGINYEDGTCIGIEYIQRTTGCARWEVAIVPFEWDTATWYDPCEYRHHHAPTVEDVLREFAGDIADVLGGDDFKLDGNDELFAEYAAKLRLAEGVDA